MSSYPAISSIGAIVWLNYRGKARARFSFIDKDGHLVHHIRDSHQNDDKPAVIWFAKYQEWYKNEERVK